MTFEVAVAVSLVAVLWDLTPSYVVDIRLIKF